MFHQISFNKLKRNEKYICDDGFNTYIGIFIRYENNHALFTNTKDITILDTIIKNNGITIHYNTYSKYYTFYKNLSLLCCIPSLVNYHPYLINISIF